MSKYRYTITGIAAEPHLPVKLYRESELVEADDVIDVLLMLFQGGAIAEGIDVKEEITIQVAPVREGTLH